MFRQTSFPKLSEKHRKLLTVTCTYSFTGDAGGHIKIFTRQTLFPLVFVCLVGQPELSMKTVFFSECCFTPRTVTYITTNQRLCVLFRCCLCMWHSVIWCFTLHANGFHANRKHDAVCAIISYNTAITFCWLMNMYLYYSLSV